MVLKAFLPVFIFSISGFSKTIVMIDPGHGGEDEGAAQNGVKEKDLTLKVSLELKKLLQKDPKFEVLLTRDRDQFVALADRPVKAAKAKADVFVSIHANSSTVSSAKGTEIYFENQIPTDEDSLLIANRENNMKDEGQTKTASNKNSDLTNILTDLAHNEHMVLSEQLSQHLLESFQKEFNIKTRAIRQAPFRVLSVNIPATLIELGFITNPTEAKWLAEAASQKKMAKAIYNGLKAFKEKLDKVHSSTVK